MPQRKLTDEEILNRFERIEGKLEEIEGLILENRTETQFKARQVKIVRALTKKKIKPMREFYDIMPKSTTSMAIKELEKSGIVEKIPDLEGGKESKYLIRLLNVPKELLDIIKKMPSYG